MKLITFSTPSDSTQRIGIFRDDGVVDLSEAGNLPGTMLELLAGGDAAMTMVRSVSETASETLDPKQVTLHAPIPNPGKVLAIGLNYGDHIEETGMAKPEHQVWFNKQHNCINDPYADIDLTEVSSLLDYEAELCLVIGKRCKHVPRERAAEVIAGYFCGNDVTIRDWQIRAPTMQIGKSFDTHGPIGPWLVTPDEVGDPHNLNIRALVNGEVRQTSNTRHLIFDCYDAIAHLTQAFTLDVGDVLFMGTPAGVGALMKPPQWLVKGDVVRIEVEKLGYIENRVAIAPTDCVIG